MGSTPKYGLPWPEYSDRSDVPTFMENLATATEAAVDGVETTLTDHHHDTRYLRLSGGTVNGDTTFQAAVNVPSPMDGAHAATKTYVDQQVGNVGGGAVTVTYGTGDPPLSGMKAGDIHAKFS